MMKVTALLALLVVVGAIPKDPLLDGTKLVFTFLVNRHGDRTPVESSLVYSNNVDKLKELSKPYGYGQLTNMGKQHAYELGKFIRSRYNELLSPQYNRSEVYIRSTDSTRAKMTSLAMLAAVYPPGKDSWSKLLRWTPVPYTTVPAKYDFNLPILNCPTYITGYEELSKSKPASLDQYHDVITLLSKKLGSDFTQTPAIVYDIYDLYTSQMSLGLPLDPEIQKAFPEIAKAAGVAIDVVHGNKSYNDLQAGVLLNEFFLKADAVISGKDTQRLRIYSAHDFTVYFFEAITRITNRQGVPKYASAYALEVRKIVETGKYVVLPTYLPSPGKPVKYLQVEGCSQLCDLEKFREITSPYVLDVDTWRTKCGFTNDLDVDDNIIN